jgi:hypothetical protein
MEMAYNTSLRKSKKNNENINNNENENNNETTNTNINNIQISTPNTQRRELPRIPENNYVVIE